MPSVTRAGGAIPGPSRDVHVAACTASLAAAARGAAGGATADARTMSIAASRRNIPAQLSRTTGVTATERALGRCAENARVRTALERDLLLAVIASVATIALLRGVGTF